MKDNNNRIDRLSSMGRRRFVSTLSALAVSASTLKFMSQDALAEVTDDPKNEVPYVEHMRHVNPEEVRKGKPPKREPVYKTISRDRWIQIEAAHNGAQKINRLLKNKGVNQDLVVAGVTTITDGHQRKKAIVVKYRIHNRVQSNGELVRHTPDIPFEQLSEIVPAQVNGTAKGATDKDSWTVEGIPTVVQQKEVTDMGQCKKYWYDENYDGIPAGASYKEDGHCTVGTPVYNNSDDERQLVSAGHCLVGDKGDDIYQPAGSSPDGVVGKARDTTWDDFGLIHSFDSNEGWEKFKYRLADDSGGYKSNLYVEGRLNWSTIKYHENDSDFEIKKQGSKTGTTSGMITETYEDSGRYYFNTDLVAYEGDSGGPFYHVYDDGYVAIAGVVSRGNVPDNCPGSDPGGTAMERIENEYHVTV